MRIGIANYIGHQSRLAWCVLAQQHHGILHTGAGTQRGSDFAQFDAESAQFDLIVVATEIIERAVDTPTRQIAAAVHPCTRVFGERIGHEAFGSQIRTTEISARQLRAGDIEFARYAMWAQLRMRIENVDAHAGERASERDALLILTQPVHEAAHRGFRRAVVVEDLRAGRTRTPPAHGIG